MQKKAEKSMLSRMGFLAVIFGAVVFIVVIGRLFVLQVNGHDFYKEKAMNQQTKDKILYPVRGTIYDTNMKPLAFSATTEMVTLEAVKIDNDEQGLLIAQGLSEILEMDYDTILAKVQKKETYSVVKRGVEKEVADKVRAFIRENKLDSIFLVEDATRYYPYGNFLSHTIGFVGSDEQGLAGLEIYYEDVLAGTPGRVITATDANGEEMPVQYEMYYPAEDGDSLVLTIDEVLQHYLEKNLEIALNDNKVQNRVAGVVVNVNTGGILAMATIPNFDPNDPFTLVEERQVEEIDAIEDPEERKAALVDARNEQWRNKVISDAYYPGSTFKIITASVALEEKATTVDTCYFCSGVKQVATWPIHCWRSPNSHGTQTLVEAIRNSCNPAFIEIGQSIGWATFEEYVDAFGLMDKTGVDLPGEQKGVFFQTRTETDLAVLSFGQNFSVTPLQLVTAVSAVANGGTLLKPHLVKQIVNADGEEIASFGREEVRQVISAETSELMNEILESVVTLGTGKNAYTTGYRVAGKTGTTEKIDKINLTGDKSLRISSFIAYAPADDPQIAVLILLDEPTVYPVTGGVTVAPVIRRFMEEALPYLDVQQQLAEEERTHFDVTVPDVRGLSFADAEAALKAVGLSYRSSGESGTVTDQIPAPGAIVSETANVVLYLGKQAPDNMINVPDLSGMSMNRAQETLRNLGLYIRFTGAINATEGTIVVTKQDMEKDSQVAYGSVVTVEITDMDQRVT